MWNAYHTQVLPTVTIFLMLSCLCRPFLVGDLPFGCYESSPLDAVKNAVRIMKEGHMDAVKLEGVFAHLPQLPL